MLPSTNEEPLQHFQQRKNTSAGNQNNEFITGGTTAHKLRSHLVFQRGVMTQSLCAALVAMAMNATRVLSAAGRSPQNVQVLTCCHNIYLSPCLFILYSNIKLWNKIKTFDQWADNILCCRQIREVNDYPHASLISYLSSVVYYWVFMTATVWRQCPLASTTGRSYSPPIMDIFSWCTPVKTTTMGFSQTYKTLWGTVIVFVILPHINLGLLSDYKICGDPECESKS